MDTEQDRTPRSGVEHALVRSRAARLRRRIAAYESQVAALQHAVKEDTAALRQLDWDTHSEEATQRLRNRQAARHAIEARLADLAEMRPALAKLEVAYA
jgi:hypothetical protein